jgi:hypothetical protein
MVSQIVVPTWIDLEEQSPVARQHSFSQSHLPEITAVARWRIGPFSIYDVDPNEGR